MDTPVGIAIRSQRPTSLPGRGAAGTPELRAEAARRKPTLALYAREKQVIEKVPSMDNSRGGAMLSDERSVMLRTRVTRAKYMNVDVRCSMCTQGADETAEHAILKCADLQPNVLRGEDISSL